MSQERRFVLYNVGVVSGELLKRTVAHIPTFNGATSMYGERSTLTVKIKSGWITGDL